MIDFDKGISRVNAQHRKTTIVSDTYEEILKDLNSPEVAAAETIIIDTGGSLISYLQDWAMRSNPSTNKLKMVPYPELDMELLQQNLTTLPNASKSQ